MRDGKESWTIQPRSTVIPNLRWNWRSPIQYSHHNLNPLNIRWDSLGALSLKIEMTSISKRKMSYIPPNVIEVILSNDFKSTHQMYCNGLLLLYRFLDKLIRLDILNPWRRSILDFRLTTTMCERLKPSLEVIGIPIFTIKTSKLKKKNYLSLVFYFKKSQIFKHRLKHERNTKIKKLSLVWKSHL